VLVQSTGPASPARRAGILSGDIIVGADGVSVRDVDDLHRLMTDERVGRSLPLVVLRQGQKVEFAVMPEELPSPRAS
jgi:S1-C subfamily serine protease